MKKLIVNLVIAGLIAILIAIFVFYGPGSDSILVLPAIPLWLVFLGIIGGESVPDLIELVAIWLSYTVLVFIILSFFAKMRSKKKSP